MSILIKGVEMPKLGELLVIEIHPDGKVSYNLDLKTRKIATAIPVPDHGRLGDLDELNKSFDTVLSRYDAGLIDNLTCINMLLQTFNNSKTVIPADKEGEA